VGDSRIYLFRQGTWRQITKDHSLVQQMVDKGIITNDIAEVHPNKNLILQAVGSGNIQPDISSEKLENGDVLLLCSDGLSGKVGGEEMLRIVEKHSPTNACKELVNLANERGGDDNITVTVIRVDQ
ncbi:MAG: serine/threonine-protein phosphatase, partial [Candidatus Marinimicrobia bacterium]|nr:serine/threonine-protein phosphatase [Candidatus Neomarinimicrobiota bacterium]